MADVLTKGLSKLEQAALRAGERQAARQAAKQEAEFLAKKGADLAPGMAKELRAGGAKPGKFKSLLGDSPTAWSEGVQGIESNGLKQERAVVDELLASQEIDRRDAIRLQNTSSSEKKVLQPKTRESLLAEEKTKQQASINQKINEAEVGDHASINDYEFTPEEEAARHMAAQEKQLAAAQAADAEEITNGSLESNTSINKKIRNTNSNTTKAGNQMYGIVKQNERMAYESEMQATEAALVEQGRMTEKEVSKDQARRVQQETKRRAEEAKRAAVNEFNYDDINNQKYFKDIGTPWSTTARAALGTAVVGAGICAALSSSRGQQSNAQLYGQQPLY